MTAEYFSVLFHGCTGILNTWTNPPKLSRYWNVPDELGAAADHCTAESKVEGRNVYCGVCLGSRPKGEGQRFAEQDISMVPGIWLDIDVMGSQHKAAKSGRRQLTYPSSAQAAMTALKPCMPRIGLNGSGRIAAPTMAVHSGGGLHLYWLFDKPFGVLSEDDREKARDATGIIHSLVGCEWMRRGWQLDKTGDLARILRPAGLRNWKHEGAETKLLYSHGPRYEMDALVSALRSRYQEMQEPVAPPPEAVAAEFAAAGAPDQWEDTYSAATYMGVSLEDRIARFAARLRTYPPAVSGEKGHNTALTATRLRHEYGVPYEAALNCLVEAYNPLCQPPWSVAELRHKLDDASPAEGRPPGCALVDMQEVWRDDDPVVPAAAARSAAIAANAAVEVREPMAEVPQSKVPAPPSDQELVDLYKDTHYGVFIDAVRAVAPVKPALAIAAATVLQSALLAPRVTVGNRRANAYSMLIAQPASGKGLCEGAVLDAMAELDLATIPVSSTKSFVKQLGPNPWGTLLISEFTPFLQSHSWTADVIPILNAAFDAKQVSLNSERTGNANVSGAAPSLMSGCQTMAFLQDGMSLLLHNGFLSRNLMAVDDTVYPELGRLSRTGGGTVETARFMPSWREFLGNVPNPIRPNPEETKATGSGANIKERGIGRWVHGRPSANVMVAEYLSIWYRLDFPSTLLPSMRRLVPHYLPLLSMPFMTAEDWRDMRIPKAALERGERALLAYYWALARAVDIMPETAFDTLSKRMLACVRDHGPITKRELQRRVNGWKNAKEFQDGLDTLVAKGSVTVEERKNAGARPSTVYKSGGRTPTKMADLPPMPEPESVPPPSKDDDF